MSRILLADDSPQALRLAEQILRRDGIEVVSITDGGVALRRLSDVDPDLLIADVFLPTKNAFDLARYVRSQARHSHVRVIFAAAPSDDFNEQDARNAGADVILRKPLEASALITAVSQLLQQSEEARVNRSTASHSIGIDREAIRASVTLALDHAMPALIEELTERVVLALNYDGRHWNQSSKT